jgi:multiple sugar transport system substrate-binding protein
MKGRRKIMSRKRIFRRLWIVLCLILVASFAVVSTVFAQSKKYAGKELVISADAGVSGTMIQKYGPGFEKLTGCKITWVGIPMDAIYSKTMIELKTGTGAYDIIGIKPFYGGDIMGAGYVLELDEYIDQSGDWWSDIIPSFRERSNKWGGKIMAVQFDGDVHALFYRKDLFEHVDEKAAFKKKYGYELDAKNMTWGQYLVLCNIIIFNYILNGSPL